MKYIGYKDGSSETLARLEQLFGARAMKQEDTADVKPTGISHVVFGDCLKPSHQARVGIVQLE